jgi:uncharacterized membrane protein YvlD (DUF360 family)
MVDDEHPDELPAVGPPAGEHGDDAPTAQLSMLPVESPVPVTSREPAGQVEPGLQPRVVPAELASLNEAVPAEAPPAGQTSVGTIPQANAARIWARAQVTNWRLYLVRFVCAGLAVVLTVLLLPGLRFERWQWGQFAQIAIVFGVLNMTFKPVLQFLSLRFIFSTYGLVVVVINTLLLVLLGMILPDLVNAERPTAVLAGGLLVGILGLVFETILGANPPMLDRDYKERNGLA